MVSAEVSAEEAVWPLACAATDIVALDVIHGVVPMRVVGDELAPAALAPDRTGVIGALVNGFGGFLGRPL